MQRNVGRDRSRSPRRNDRHKAPIHYDYPKFERNNTKPTIVNQLSEDALYKQSSKPFYKPRSDRFPDSRNNSVYRPRNFGDDDRSNRRNNDFSRDRGDRRSDDRRDSQRHKDESAFKINDVFSAPRSSYYFEHDNRDGDRFDRSPPRRQRRSNDFSGGSSRRHDDFGHKRSERFDSRAEPRDNTGKYFVDRVKPRDPSENTWRHDMFEQEVVESKDDRRESRHRSRS